MFVIDERKSLNFPKNAFNLIIDCSVTAGWKNVLWTKLVVWLYEYYFVLAVCLRPLPSDEVTLALSISLLASTCVLWSSTPINSPFEVVNFSETILGRCKSGFSRKDCVCSSQPTPRADNLPKGDSANQDVKYVFLVFFHSPSRKKTSRLETGRRRRKMGGKCYRLFI